MTPVTSASTHPATVQVLSVLRDYAVAAAELPAVLAAVAGSYGLALTVAVRSQLPRQQAACSRGHVWTPETTGYRRDGTRVCLTCVEVRAANLPQVCPNGHPYTPANTYTRPSGRRDCRICMRQRARHARQHRAQQLRNGGGRR